MPDRLPVRVDPYRLAEKGLALSGKLEISKMPRLMALITEPSGHVVCELSFSKRARQYFLTGHIQGNLELVCQRCLEPYTQEIDSNFSLLLVAGDQEAEKVLDTAEPLIVVDDELDVSVVVEDEILLSMPAIPKHDDLSDCTTMAVTERKERMPEQQQENPFAVLENLKKH